MNTDFEARQHVSARDRPLSALALTCCIIGTIILHCSLFLILYRGRVVSRWHIAESEFMVLYFPPLVAFASYAYLLSRTGICMASPRTRVVGIFVIALVMTFISLVASMILSFNLYGT